METLFFASAALLAYVYVGYPLLLGAWSAIGGRAVRRRADAATSAPWPTVTIVVAVYNEAGRLPGRIANLLDQTYPGWFDILVVCDGSTDHTRRMVEGLDERVRLLEVPRGGKALALNAGVAAASGEIVAFADARQRWAPTALAEMVANFDDPEVGGVSGELILDSESQTDVSDSTVGEAVGLYWRYEKWLRRRESFLWSTLGATGAIYAIRRALWRPLPADTLLDDVLGPMRVVFAGKRIVFEHRARAFDAAASNGAAETRRKTRTLAGNYQILALEPRLLWPLANPIWVQYMSHKVGRLVAPWALIAALLTSLFLASESWFYAAALILQLCFYGLAAVGGWIEAERGDETGALVPLGSGVASEPHELSTARAGGETGFKAS